MSKEVNVYHFESKKPEVTLELKIGKESKVVKFVNHEIVIDDKAVADKIQETKLFKRGMIYFADSPIARANRLEYKGRANKIRSGASGTSDEVSELQKKLREAEAKIAELEAK